MIYQVAIVGGGPAGSSCAAFCAARGLRTIVIEREKFPREKVCGDCLNPSSWPVLRRLGLEERVHALPHAVLERVEFVGSDGRRLEVELPGGANGEIAIKRSVFDLVLVTRAAELGAEVRQSTTVNALREDKAGWRLFTNDGCELQARVLVGADGRNSTIARLVGLLPRAAKERVALQAHVPLPAAFGQRVVLQLLGGGYCGQAPVNAEELNVCLVGRAESLPELREWAANRFRLPRDQQWRSITPLTRGSIPAAGKRLFFAGDAARVVEPFTGEGISYAIRSGEIAASAVERISKGISPLSARVAYRREFAAMYRGRLWINALARAAVVSPKTGSFLFRIARRQPLLLRHLTRAIVH